MSIFPKDITASASLLLEYCGKRRLLLATAESCTGGLLAACLTSIAGSSDVFERGFVTYSNQAKVDLLGVNPDTLSAYGAVSRESAFEMAEGTIRRSAADIGISITGIAGPGGGSEAKPVGLVHMAVCRKSSQPQHQEFQFGPQARTVIQLQAVRAALLMLDKAVTAN